MNIFVVIMLVLTFHAQPVTMTVTPAHLHPGSPFILNIKGAATGTAYNVNFDKHTLPVMNRSGHKISLLLGVDLTHSVGIDHIELYSQGITVPIASAAIGIGSYNYPSQYLKLPKRFVELTPDELKRALKEQKELEHIFAQNSTKALWKGDFIIPVHGIITARFGVKRFLNGEPRSSHTGIDIAAKKGTSVAATNNGIVRFTGNLFFSGNSVIIDHGQGVYSMYFHLEKYTVRNGEYVSRGQIIGYVGKTGRVTGPSLHFGIRALDSRIDPQLVFSLTQGIKEK